MSAPGEASKAESRCVLDASALLAYLHDEDEGARVRGELAHALMSSVNWSEVVQKALAYNTNVTGLRQDLEALGLQIVDFDARQAEAAAELWTLTRSAGLSLADRACLALARARKLPALTSDKVWTRVSPNVQMIR